MSLFKKPRDTVCINFHPHFLWILSTVVDVIRLVVSTLSNMYEVSLSVYWALSAILFEDTWVSVSVTSLLCFRDSVTNIRSAPVWGLHQGSSRCVKKKKKHISTYIEMCNNTIRASKHGWVLGHASGIIFHLCWGSRILCVTARSPLAVLGSCPSPSPLVRSSQHGSMVTEIRRLHFLGGWPSGPGSYCPSHMTAGLLFAPCTGVVWQLCAKHSLNFSSPRQWKRETLFRVNIRKISPLLICSNK